MNPERTRRWSWKAGWVGIVEIVFETHSMSEDNERGVATGWYGGKLSVEGQVQARQLGERRRDDHIAAVFSSDLNRAVETARIAFAETTIPISLDWRLRECNYGTLNGMSHTQLDLERSRRLDQPFPGGESWRDAVARVVSFLHDLAEEFAGQRVLLIGHVATRWALDHYVLGTPVERLLAAPFQWQEGWEYRLRATSGS
jgi:2,3-bisphosphoglycerate-dependent phosphoglycerate mutase